jgi:4-hydroxybenzoate polyprenyltransferase
MKAFLGLIRWKNLLLIIATMVLMRYAVIESIIGKINVVLIEGNTGEMPMTLQLPWYDFVFLVLATVFIAAGGYVINDYFDIKTDLINRGQVIVGTKIPRRQAMMLHSVLNIAGVGLGFFLSWSIGYFWLGLLFLVVSGLLYFYSASYKRQFLVGNLIVALLVATVPLLVGIFEWPALYRFYAVKAMVVPDIGVVFWWMGGFALFAFLTTLTREVIKDIEDFEGDLAYGRNTIPVVTGILTARIISVSMVIITVVMLYLAWHLFLNDKITLIYVSLAIALPLLITICLLTFGHERKQLHNASRLMKIVMTTGILYSVIVKIILTWNLI